MNKIDLIIDALSVAQNLVWSALNEQALAAARELQAESAMLKMPTKIFGPNLEQILNAAGFYRREWVGLTDDEVEFIADSEWEEAFVRLVESKLKEKNNAI